MQWIERNEGSYNDNSTSFWADDRGPSGVR
jgi:hypothetical protein